ncbi:MAG: phosphopantetheine-binding protein [Balneolaceae bacterium]
MITPTSIQGRVLNIVCESLTVENIEIEQDLIESGLLDSLALVGLMMALEDGFEITISPEELDIEDYRSIKNMSKMVARISFENVLRNYA